MNHRYKLFYAVCKALLILADEIEFENKSHCDSLGKVRKTLLKVFVESSTSTDKEMLEELEQINLTLTGISVIPEGLLNQEGSLKGNW